MSNSFSRIGRTAKVFGEVENLVVGFGKFGEKVLSVGLPEDAGVEHDEVAAILAPPHEPSDSLAKTYDGGG